MKIVVGLGNPGDKYRNNRHNVGFMIIDRIKEFDGEVLKIGEVVLVKPQTFMNRSGEAIGKIVNFYKVAVDDLIVIHDDLDIKLGEYKIQKGVGPKVHNGLTSIEEHLGKKDFWRVRVGIDNRPMANGEWRMAGEDYVLADFTSEEKAVLDRMIKIIVDQLVAQFKI